MSETRVDLHCHSSASEVSRLGVQRALGLPECATPPQEAYLHSLQDRRPEMTDWLRDCERAGDETAQHGFQHLQARRSAEPSRLLSGREAEFVGLDEDETRRSVEAGRRVLKLADIEPRGFVAPAYAYTPALRRALSTL